MRGLRRAAGRLRDGGGDPAPPTRESVAEYLERLAVEATSPADRAIVERAMPYTLTGAARLRSLVDAVRHCARRGTPGAFAECGVWLGGSVLAMILALQDEGVEDRDIWLYDTFEGMTEPTEADTSAFDRPAREHWELAERNQSRPWPEWFNPETFNLDVVRDTLLDTGYPAERLHFVAGRVEDTIPAQAPDELALLRLDTDWYESTAHEMAHLYPRLVRGGVLVVDDYGHWDGARRAIDEYFAAHGPAPMLHRVDYSARIAVKDR